MMAGGGEHQPSTVSWKGEAKLAVAAYKKPRESLTCHSASFSLYHGPVKWLVLLSSNLCPPPSSHPLILSSTSLIMLRIPDARRISLLHPLDRQSRNQRCTHTASVLSTAQDNGISFSLRPV
jgi:hypothetical protein